MLRGFDVSGYQAGIGIAAMEADFVIVKATEGTAYVNPDYRRQADEALASGKLLGCYHYAYGSHSPGSAADEARHFLERFAPYRGRAIPVLDWEAEAQSLPVSWALEWLEAVEAETGATPWFYAYASYLNSRDHSAISRFPLWMASYLSRYAGGGYVDGPENIWPTGSWDGMVAYQYTSEGRLDGYGGNLDLDVFYGSRGDWIRMQGGAMGSIERMVQHAVGIAQDDSHGYSWADRWNVDRDCSSLMYDSADAAGYPVGRGPDRTRYTGTMPDDFQAAGFTLHAYGSVDLRRGDILLRDPWGDGGHTEMYVGGGMTVGAHSSETGGVYGQPGDQTGNEISVAPLWGSWEWVLRPPEGGESEDDMGIYDAHESVAGDGSVGSPSDRIDYIDMRVNQLVQPHESAAGDGKKDGIRDQVDYIDKRVKAMSEDVAQIKKQLGSVLKLLRKGA